MNILLLEDHGKVAIPLQGKLEREGYQVFPARSIYEAKEIWKANNINRLIVDLEMPPNGLKEQAPKPDQPIGRFSGWNWLKEDVFKKDESYRRKTIILTAFWKEFEKHIDKKDRSGIHLIKKKGKFIATILNVLKTIKD